jgi:hypothetical protein
MNLHMRGNRAWVAAFALVLLVNAIVLGGAFYNRSGEEARLVLSERELEIPFRWDRDSENTGLALQIRWRNPVPAFEEQDDSDSDGVSSRRHGPAHWLDEAKMIELGFQRSGANARPTDWSRGLSREIWLVLEFDGPEHQRALQSAERDLRTAEAQFDPRPDYDHNDSELRSARNWLRKEQVEASRLFAIDAGLDVEALRGLYPQRDRHLIVRARVRPSSQHYGPHHPDNRKLGGHIQGLSIGSVHVPLQFHDVFEGARPTHHSDRPDVHYSVTLAYGRRHEPWIVDAARLPPPPQTSTSGPAQGGSGSTDEALSGLPD